MNKITMTLNVDHLIKEALQEDISSEDVTTNAVMKEAVTGEVQLICKQDGVVAGLDVFHRVFEILDENVKTDFYCKDGDEVEKRRIDGDYYRRYPCAALRGTGGTELSAENEWNCDLYTFGCNASGRNEDEASGHQKDNAEYAYF
mgnify:FL=1